MKKYSSIILVLAMLFHLLSGVSVFAAEPNNIFADEYNFQSSWIMSDLKYRGAANPEYIDNEDGRHALRFYGNTQGFIDNGMDYSSGSKYSGRLQQKFLKSAEIQPDDYIVVKFWAKAVSEDGNECYITPSLQVVNESDSAGAGGASGGSITLLTDQWQEYSYILQAKALKDGDTGYRIVLNLGYYKQTTYISDFTIENYGTENPDEDLDIPEEYPKEISLSSDIVRFGSGNYDMTLPAQATDLGDNPPVSNATYVAGIGNGGYYGMRSGLFQISEENTYVVASYWVKMKALDADAELSFLGRLQYFNSAGSTGGSTYLYSETDVRNATAVEDGMWYRVFQIYKIPALSDPLRDADFDRLRFIICPGVSGTHAETYIGGFEILDFGTEFTYGNKTDTVSSIKAYINDSSLKNIRYGNQSIDGFDPSVTGYVTESVSAKTVSVVPGSVFSEYEIIDEGTVPGSIVIHTRSYCADRLNEHGDFYSQCDYRIWVKNEDVWSIGNADVSSLHMGENTVNINVYSKSESTEALLMAVLYDTKTNAVCGADMKPVSSTGVYPVTLTVPENTADLCLAAFILDGVSYKPLTDRTVLIGTMGEPVDIDTDSDLSVVQNFETGMMEVCGTLSEQLPLRISVIAVNGTEVSDDSVAFADVVKASTDGNFAFSFVPYSKDKNSQFTMYVCDEKTGEQIEKPFYWYSDGMIDDAVEWFKTASESDVADALLTKDSFINGNVRAEVLFGSILEQYYSLRDKTAVNRALAKKAFADADELKDTCLKAVNDARLCEQFADADISELKRLIETNGSTIGLYIDGDYGYSVLENSDLEEILNGLAGQQFSSVSELAETYNTALILYIFNQYPWGKLEAAAAAYADDLNIDLNSNAYKKISSSRSTLYKTLANAVFADLSDIKQLFDSTVESLYEQSHTGGSSSGGTGGGGTGSSYSVYDNSASQAAEKNDTVLPVFSDVSSAAWAEKYIMDLYYKGIVSGDGTGRFNPNATLTRAEYVKMIVLALGLFDQDTDVSFADCGTGDWYYNYVASGVSAGIVYGKDNGSFGADEPVTRQDMAVLAYRGLLASGLKLSAVNDVSVFSDTSEIAEYAAEGVKMMQQLGIINGMGDNRFAPNEYSTRAMAAKVISSLLQIKQE